MRSKKVTRYFCDHCAKGVNNLHYERELIVFNELLNALLTALDEARKDTERLLDASKQALGAIQKVADITDENRLGWALKSEAIEAMKERGG